MHRKFALCVFRDSSPDPRCLHSRCARQNHFSRRYAVQKHDGMELDRLTSEKNIDPAPITLLSPKHFKDVQSEDEFEIRRRSFFGVKIDAEFNGGDERWRNCVDPF
jgi:hypothetical protein